MFEYRYSVWYTLKNGKERRKMSEVILFDLDGTITASAEGITKCIQYALGHFGIKEPDLKKLECFIGPPLKEQFMKYSNLSEKQAETAVSLYRERYVTTGIYENKLYDGIESVLRLLKAKGKTLGIASAKPTVYVTQVLENFNLTQYFSVVVGAELDGTRSDKAEIIEEALALLGMQDNRWAVVMVGDRGSDVKGALKCGIQCIGVAYGYGGIYELETAGAIYIAQTVEDLKVLAGSSRSNSKDNANEARNQAPQQAMQIGLWHKLWRVLYPIGFYYVIMLATTIIISIIIMALSGAWHGYDIEALTQAEQRHQLLIASISAIISIPVFIGIYRTDWRLRAKGVLGSKRGKERNSSMGAYAATVLLMISASQALNILINIFRLNEIFPHYAENVNDAIVAQPALGTSLLVVGMLLPLVEELVFRGLVFKRIQDYAGTFIGIFVSGLLFGIYHNNMVQFIYATLLGWLLAFIFNQTRNIIIPIIGHMVANIWSIVVQRLLGNIMPRDEVFEYVLVGVLITVAILSLIYICRWKENAVEVNQGE